MSKNLESGVTCSTLVAMNKKERKELVSVKIEKTVVEMVREWKRGTFIPVGIFFAEAAKEKLGRDQKEKNENKKG